jgi:hypothetical protein
MLAHGRRAGKRKSMHRVEELVRLPDQARRQRLVVRVIIKCGVFKHLDHLPREVVALGGDVFDPPSSCV